MDGADRDGYSGDQQHEGNDRGVLGGVQFNESNCANRTCVSRSDGAALRRLAEPQRQKHIEHWHTLYVFSLAELIDSGGGNPLELLDG
ncbi:MAG: hypothetical protein BroJett021_27870 [Chloroflexota bacterium]|nr:MAG: hypothetical protein BroJett021_27870 [Chloroflexota bacterium]